MNAHPAKQHMRRVRSIQSAREQAQVAEIERLREIARAEKIKRGVNPLDGPTMATLRGGWGELTPAQRDNIDTRALVDALCKPWSQRGPVWARIVLASPLWGATPEQLSGGHGRVAVQVKLAS